MHAIKIEDLDIETKKADLMVETFRDILLELEFSSDRIEGIHCRSCDGFIPYSHNKGGLIGRSCHMNSHLLGSGYDYGNNMIQSWSEEQNSSYKEEHPRKFRFIEQVWSGKRKESDMYQTVLDHYYEYVDGNSEYDTTQFEVRFMVTSDGTIDVDVFGATKDAPYFRSSDYNEHKNFEFENADQFKKSVMEFLNTCDCVDLIGNGF